VGQVVALVALHQAVGEGYSSGHNHCAPVGRAASRIST
jgi:galactose mutarotase-like enzyme